VTEQRRAVELTDARALRAYAHPIRMKLVGLLRIEGTLTASRAAELLGESTGTTSFHLRQLAKYGLAEQAEGGRGREKPWRATALFTRLPDVTTNPDVAEAAQAVKLAVAATYYSEITDWIHRSPQDPVQWQRAAAFGDSMLYLTAAELVALNKAVEQLLEPYVSRLVDSAERPDDARLVSFLRLHFPVEPPR
jgi:hypothetical protein